VPTGRCCAWAAVGVAFSFPHLSSAALVPLMVAAAFAAGGVWIALPAVARLWLGVNEIISTLLLNFVAGYWSLHWAGKVWVEPTSTGSVKSRAIPPQADIGGLVVGGVTIPTGLFIACGAALIVWFVLRFTHVGYQVRMLGRSSHPGFGAYAGMPGKRRILEAMLVGGALAGIAGALQVMGAVHRYGEGVTQNTGYLGIVVAILAGGSALGVVVMGVAIAVVIVAGDFLQVLGTSSTVVFIISGLILVLAASSEGLSHHGRRLLDAVRRRPGRVP
jgi:general nucleoside transport system permease protein